MDDDRRKQKDQSEQDQGSKGGQAGGQNETGSLDNEYQEGIEYDKPISEEKDEDSNLF